MEIFNTIAVWLEESLLPFGGIGLMLLAICDSSFFSLPEINDILVMTFSIRQPDQMVVFAGLTTLGSVIGCAMLYGVGRSSGAAFLRRRVRKDMPAERMEKIRGWYEKYGMLAVIVPSLLPPPTPFKVFVLSAGTFGISWPKFLAAVAIGRSIRYFSQGILAVMYGEAAIQFAQVNYPVIGVVVSVLIVIASVAFVMWRRKQGDPVA
jgi:membrane protein YqaA with SNARE-associated domain